MADSFANAEANELGSTDLEAIAMAAFESRIETLFIEEDRIVLGKIDYKTGKVDFGDIDHPSYDDLPEMVLSGGGAVFVLEKDVMPGTTTGIAAIYIGTRSKFKYNSSLYSNHE